MNRFRHVVGSPQVVLLARFTFINFFMHHHDWEWRLADEWKSDPVHQVWSVTRDGTRVRICRATPWSMDMADVVSYTIAAECLEKSGATRVALFQTQWNLERPNWDTSKTAQFVNTLADRADLRATAF